jgi:hypothetical protein
MVARAAFRAVLVAAVALPAMAQVPFLLTVGQGTSRVLLQNNGLLSFTSLIGQPQAQQITATYTGNGKATIPGPPLVFGSTVFTINSSAVTPIVLNNGDTFVFTVQFLPTSGTLVTGQVGLAYSESVPVTATAPCPSSPGAEICVTSNSVGFNTQGTAPSFVFSYVLQSTQNAVTLAPGQNIVFPTVPVGTTESATFGVSNNGSAAGSVTVLSIGGSSAFKFSGIPILPFSVPAGQSLQVQLTYQPTSTAGDVGQIQVAVAGGTPITIGLQGNGTSASLVYQVLQTNPPTTLAPGGTLTLPNTNVGQTSTVSIRVLNTGNASGQVTTLSVTGPGFQIVNPALPQTLAPNASITFTVNFTPAQPVPATGTLTINQDTINLAATGLGPQLQFSYSVAGTTITIGTANPSVIFSPAAITQSSQVILDVKNTGTVAAVISNIGISQTNSPFTLSGFAAPPISVAPNSDFQITIKFTPTVLGFSNATLQLDAATVPLVGSGTQPPPLPAYTITGSSGSPAPLTQPLIGLSLASPYPVSVAGTLSLTVSGAPVVDPAVQFSSGGIAAPFVIPANSPDAVFTNQGKQIGLQTGTVASTITLSPTFATQAGAVNLTPDTPTTLRLTIAPAAPTLIAAQIGTVTTVTSTTTSAVTSSFVLTVTGFSVTRSLSSFSVQFTPATGFSIPTTQFKIDLTQLSALWFQSSASAAFGGEFALAVPFTFLGTPPSGKTLLDSIGAVSVSITNSLGTSNTLQIN